MTPQETAELEATHDVVITRSKEGRILITKRPDGLRIHVHEDSTSPLELVYADSPDHFAVYRLPVPSGWIYLFGEFGRSHVFVPHPPTDGLSEPMPTTLPAYVRRTDSATYRPFEAVEALLVERGVVVQGEASMALANGIVTAYELAELRRRVGRTS